MKKLITYSPIDLKIPFNLLNPSDIDIYFHYTNEISKKTCKANCDFCYLKTVDEFSIPFDTAVQIIDALKQKWYNIWLIPPDTFSEWFLEILWKTNIDNSWGSAFGYKNAWLEDAWTSGKPLLLEDYTKKLELAYECWYRSITLSPHNAADTYVPFDWVTKGSDVLFAIENIQKRNSVNSDKAFKITTTFTIGTYNNTFDVMDRIVQWAIRSGVGLVRFNCFNNFSEQKNYQDYEMWVEDMKTFGDNLLMILDKYCDASILIWLSEDWWDAFLNQGLLWYLDDWWKWDRNGRCRWWYSLFAMVPRWEDLVLVWCVDNRNYGEVLGKVISDGCLYDIQRNIAAIEQHRNAIVEGELYSCFGWSLG